MRWSGWEVVAVVQSGHRTQGPVQQEGRGQIWPELVTNFNIGKEPHIFCSSLLQIASRTDLWLAKTATAFCVAARTSGATRKSGYGGERIHLALPKDETVLDQNGELVSEVLP